MKIDQFNQVVAEQVEHSLAVLAEKGAEYSLGADRLDHFKDAATEQDMTPKQALWGMLAKHLASLTGMCKNGKPETLSKERWLEKITDSINYLLLLRALIEEDYEHEKD